MTTDTASPQLTEGRTTQTQALSFGGTYGAPRAYDAGRRDIREMNRWITRIGQVDDEALVSRDQIVANARDLVRNNPIISGGVDRRTEAVVGSRIRLKSQPDFEAMGRNFDWSDKWARGVEAQFRVWDRDSRKLCDAERAQSFGAMVETAYRHWWVDGEAVAYIEMRDRGSAYQTCVRLIDPDRLRNPDTTADGSRLKNGHTVVGGCEVDAGGVTVAYHILVDHPAAIFVGAQTTRTERIEREDADGRPRLVHAYKRNRAAQRRGISRLVASMSKIKMLDRYDKAELEKALFQALQVAVATTDVPTSELKEAMAPVASAIGEAEWSIGEQLLYRQNNPIVMDGINVFHALPGEDFKFTNGSGPPAHYADFRAEGLRSIASDFGLSHQQLAQNWEDINYSSARTLLNEIWRGLLDDRWQFTQAFCTPIYAAWLQESVAIGKVKLPGGPASFYRYRAEITMADWMGPGRGSVDPLKEAKAANEDQAAGRSNLSIEAEKMGRDHRDILIGIARERSLAEELGVGDLLEPKAKDGTPIVMMEDAE